jgi:protein tyrosine/serine phosphatase
MNRTVHAFAKMSRVDYLKAGLAALLIVFAFGLLRSSKPTINESASTEVIAAGNSSTKETAPSQFPNIKIKNFGQMDDHFYRGAQPEQGDYKAMAALGIKTVIDLRDDPTDYEKSGVEAAGMKYVNIAMSDKRKPSNDQIEAFLGIAKDEANLPVYVHCVGGRHRTGLIGAIYRFNQYGWDFEQAYKEMKNYDYYSRWGHGAIKEYVQEYYELMKTAKAAVKVTTVPAAALPADVSTQPGVQPSEPVTQPPPPKVTE